MDEKKPVISGYIKNTKTSGNRNIRLELVGDVNKSERYFLDGLSYLAAGTLSKDDQAHTKYVANLMEQLIDNVVAKLKKDMEGK